MKLFAATVISLSLFASGTTHAQARAAAGSGAAPTSSLQDSQTIKITRSSSQQSSKGPAEYFTGSVRIEPPFQCARSITRHQRERHLPSLAPGRHGTLIHLARH